jgi:hypothetical protein
MIIRIVMITMIISPLKVPLGGGLLGETGLCEIKVKNSIVSF